MPTTIHKYTVTSEDITAPQVAIHKKFADIFASQPGVTITQPMIENGNAFAIVFGLEAGKSQVVFYAMGNLQTPERYFGLCTNNYVPRLIAGQLWSPQVNWQMRPSTKNIETISDMAIAVKDNKVIGLSQRVTGFTLFHHHEDGVVAERQIYCTSNFGGQERIGTNILSSGFSACGDCIGIKPGLDDSYYISITGTSYGNVISANVSNYNMPTGKIMKYTSVKWDPYAAVSGKEQDDYPVQMTGAGVSVDPENYPSYKTIQIEGQKYIHFGANCWLPYDSIVEHSETI